MNAAEVPMTTSTSLPVRFRAPCGHFEEGDVHGSRLVLDGLPRVPVEASRQETLHRDRQAQAHQIPQVDARAHLPHRPAHQPHGHVHRQHAHDKHRDGKAGGQDERPTPDCNLLVFAQRSQLVCRLGGSGQKIELRIGVGERVNDRAERDEGGCISEEEVRVRERERG